MPHGARFRGSRSPSLCVHMDRTFHIDPDAGLVTVKLSGRLGLPELQDLSTELAQAPDYQPELPQLIDCRGVALDHGRFDPRAFLGFALRFYRARAQSSIAIVVDPTLDRVDMAGLYRLACTLDGKRCAAELFDDYQAALKWLMRREFARP